jgi:hypothetical protein
LEALLLEHTTAATIIATITENGLLNLSPTAGIMEVLDTTLGAGSNTVHTLSALPPWLAQQLSAVP